MYQVSVIVVTYNSNSLKICQTLKSIVDQLEIDFEIIICDDGSAQKDFSYLPAYFEKYNFTHYKLIENEINKGTVKNCLSGIREASGEYVFSTSPGDMLFDRYVLRDFYRFSKQNNVKICFGNAIFYRENNGNVELTRKTGKPDNPQVYNCNNPGFLIKANFFHGNWIIGASYFRRREMAVEYFSQIEDTAIYMEDTTSTAFALASGEGLCYYDRNIVWYEDGTGISTTGDRKWEKALWQDIMKSVEKLKRIHVKNPYVDVMYQNCAESNRMRRIVYKLLNHPWIMCLVFMSRLLVRPKPITCSSSDINNLKMQLEEIQNCMGEWTET